MAFRDGHKKVGGRKKGTPNKRTDSFVDLLQQFQIDPLAIIKQNIHLCEPEKQIDVSLSLLQYLYPKRKAIEIDPPSADESSAENPTEQLNRLRQMFKDGL